MENSQIMLPADLDLKAVAELKQAIVDAFGRSSALALNASESQRVTSPCLQILAAAVGQGATIKDASPAFLETAKLLDLMAPLGLEGKADV